jgi:hypothetical protein
MPVWAPSDHATLPSTRVPRDQLDLDGVMHDEPERTFKHETSE